MKIRKLILLMCILLVPFLLAGCWNYREVEKLIIVSGIAVDKKDDKYLITTEIIQIHGMGTTESTKLVTSEGDSMFDAVRNMIKIVGEKLYFSHAEIVIINKEIAEEGIIPVLDWINRDTELRYTLHVIVSKEKSAKEILEQQPVFLHVLSFELNDMLKSERNLSKTMDVEDWEFINELSAAGISASLPAVGLKINNNKLAAEINGTGVFREDRLVGFLTGEETKTLLFIKDKIKGGLLVNKEYKNNSPTYISLEIFKNKTKLKPKYSNGKITIEITTNTDVAIDENGGSENYIDEPERSKLEADFEARLENDIKELVKKVQIQYDSDIFGFGKAVKLAMPSLWKEIENKWGEEYKNVGVEVHSTINIRNSAMGSKPIKVGD